MVIYQQIQFIQNTDPVIIKKILFACLQKEIFKQDQEAFIAELKNIPGVVNASSTFHNMVGRRYSDGLEWPGKDPNKDVYFEVLE